MSVQISVQLDERGPAAIRVTQRTQRGQLLELDREDPYLTACEEDAFERLLSGGRRLPAGTIDVEVGEDEFRQLPAHDAVGRAIAARAA